MNRYPVKLCSECGDPMEKSTSIIDRYNYVCHNQECKKEGSVSLREERTSYGILRRVSVAHDAGHLRSS